MSYHWLENIEYLSDFSLKNKEDSIEAIKNLHNIYYESIINIIESETKPVFTNNLVNISDYRKELPSRIISLNSHEYSNDSKLLEFPAKEVNLISLYYEVFEVQYRVYRLIRDFKRESTNEVFKRKYRREDWVSVMEFSETKYKSLKSSFFDRNSEEEINSDMMWDYIELKDKISQQRGRFKTEYIDTFYLHSKDKINNDIYIRNKKSLNDSLEKYFVGLYAEFIRINIFEHIKRQDRMSKKILIEDFIPVLEAVNDLQVYIDENLQNKNSYFYKDFQTIYILMKRLFFS